MHKHRQPKMAESGRNAVVVGGDVDFVAFDKSAENNDGIFSSFL
jgi:hypothetical protein